MNTGLRHIPLQIWYSGHKHLDGLIGEFSKNCRFPIQDLLNRSPWSEEDTSFTYNIADIDKILKNLGILWEVSKGQPFASSTTYLGFVLNLEQQTVILSLDKTSKYINEIKEWLARPAHTLKRIKELYRKLLHTVSILPQGCTYLMGLESMLSTCIKRPFVPHCPDNGLDKDLLWWIKKLHSRTIIHSIHIPPTFLNPGAFLNASILVLELALQLVGGGMPGTYVQDGNPCMDQKTLSELKLLHLSSLSTLLTHSYPPPATSFYMVTTPASLKGGMWEDTTPIWSMPFSNMSTLSLTQPLTFRVSRSLGPRLRRDRKGVWS